MPRLNQKRRILITGGVSLLGKYLAEVLSEKNTVFITVHKTPLDYFLKKLSSASFSTDLTNLALVEKLIQEIKPDTVIHLAALSQIDYCEKHPRSAYRVNVTATRNLCRVLAHTNSQFVFASSNAVFDGRGQFYKETDKTNPINVYGKTKAEAEKIVIGTPVLSTIVRCSTFFGWQPMGVRENDVTYYLKKFSDPTSIYLVNDIFFTPIYAARAANAIQRVVQRRYAGIFHIAGSVQVTRYSFVSLIKNVFFKKLPIKLIPVKSNYFPHLAPRPKFGCLDITKMKQILKITPLTLTAELTRMKKTIPDNYRGLLPG